MSHSEHVRYVGVTKNWPSATYEHTFPRETLQKQIRRTAKRPALLDFVNCSRPRPSPSLERLIRPTDEGRKWTSCRDRRQFNHAHRYLCAARSGHTFGIDATQPVSAKSTENGYHLMTLTPMVKSAGGQTFVHVPVSR